MKNIPADMQLKVSERAPRFVVAVSRFAERNRAPDVNGKVMPDRGVHLNLAAFRGDFALLYQCLWYANTKGVPVVFSSAGERRLR